MGRPPNPDDQKPTTMRSSQTLPSSPTHSSLSSSSSEFEFMTISLSPRKSSAASATADDLFYKGQLLPLHLSPRLSMVRSLLLSSSSTSSSATTTTTTSSSSRPSTSSSRPSSATDSDSSRPSSATTVDDDELKRLKYPSSSTSTTHFKKPNKYLSSLSRFSSVFRVKDIKVRDPENNMVSASKSVKRAKEVLRKYLKKVKPLYCKLSSSTSSSQKHAHQQKIPTNYYSGNLSSLSLTSDGSVKEREDKGNNNHVSLSHSFSGNLLYPRKKACVSSCPSSMRSSPNHSGILYRNGMPGTSNRDSSSMEELQSAIQGAIAHCKKSMVENKSMVRDHEII